MTMSAGNKQTELLQLLITTSQFLIKVILICIRIR